MTEKGREGGRNNRKRRRDGERKEGRNNRKR